MKHLFIKLEIICGEYIFNSLSVHKVDQNTDPIIFAEYYAKDFWHDDDSYQEESTNQGNGAWYSLNGEVAAKVDYVQEIEKKEYLLLEKFI